MTTLASIDDARRFLSDSDVGRRALALTYLSTVSYSDRTPDLIACLQDENEDIVMTAMKGLIGQREDRAFAALLTMLESRSSAFQQAAALALGEHRDHRAIPYLLAALEHPDWQVRLCVVYGLARLGGPQVLLALHNRLTDRHRDVRFTAASCLSALELRSQPRG